MRFGTSLRSLHSSGVLAAVFLLAQLPVQAQENPPAAQAGAPQSSNVPDAQVEANVLKALAGAPQLADQNITTTTVYGVVTLSGTVRDEETRTLAETLASRAPGVKKVVGELTIGTSPASAPDQPQGPPVPGTNPNLQSDGTMAPPPPQGDQANPYPPGQGNAQQNPQYPQQPPPYPQQNPQYPPSNGPTAQHAPPPPDQGPYGGRPYGSPPSSYPQGEPYGAQKAGVSVVVPSGSMVRIRINQGLDSQHAQPGNIFDGVVLNDVVADGAVAIPRGAAIQGSVVDAKASGALKGRGEISLQLTQVTLGGKSYPLVSDRWSNVGVDKTARTVNSAIGLGAVGAIIGAVAGGGPGAAIGAGVGGAAGLGASAASGGGQALVPPEAILTFHLTQPTQVATVSQAEMDRLGYGVPTGSQPRLMRRPGPPYGGYYGPGYYARPYPAYYPYPY
ncbi:BON domain-containing protein [Granulicella sp. dw_53]|uniref:BON domain-containing protein n=1 Tax=Granulicella sp. dw_53 TaxID=2719792 RepID=UPI001BD55E77|nr:BON domain-containing protein [Granulicella sp. dw_53]